MQGAERCEGAVRVVQQHALGNLDFQAVGRQRGFRQRRGDGGQQIALGGFSSEILGSKKVMPQALTDAGFTWDYPHVTTALSALIEE